MFEYAKEKMQKELEYAIDRFETLCNGNAKVYFAFH